MAEKKATKKTGKKDSVKKVLKEKLAKNKTVKTKSKNKKRLDELEGDMGIVIVEDDIEIDQEKVNEERRAYLEEARSQEAFD